MTPFYQHNGITIYCGDCLEVLLELSPDAIVTDPPYGLERFKKGFGFSRFKGYGAEKTGLKWDVKPDQATIKLLLKTGKYHIIWGANNFTLPPSESFLVWNKHQTVDNFASAELAFSDIPSLPAKVYEYSIHKHNQSEKFHPTQKPVSLMRWCISFLPSDAKIICDPYMGSGTTLRAAQDMGLQAVGIELDEEYCQIAVQRLRQQSFSFPARSTNNKNQPELKSSAVVESHKQSKLNL